MAIAYPIVTDNDIRKFLGDDYRLRGTNGGSWTCRVKIKRDGTVHRYGSPDEFDRSHDYWHELGHRSDYKKTVSKSCMFREQAMRLRHANLQAAHEPLDTPPGESGAPCRYAITTAKGDYLAGTLSEIANWQRDHQGAFADVSDAATGACVSVDDVEFSRDAGGTNDEAEDRIAALLAADMLGQIWDAVDIDPHPVGPGHRR